MINWSELKCTHSTVLSKGGKPFVSVLFECGNSSAEGTVPDCAVRQSVGFSEEDVEQLEDYMKEHRKEIIDAAKSISSIKNWFS